MELTMKNYLISLLILLPSISIANNFVDGATITRLQAGEHYGNVVFVQVSPLPTSAPECQNSVFSYAFDPTTPVGKATLSMLLAAYASGKKVYIHGYNQCTVYPDSRDLRTVRLQ